MKKIFILPLLLALFTLNVQAKDYSSYCSTKTASKNFTGTLGSVFGVNAVKRAVIKNEIEKALKKKTGADFKVKTESFYGVSPSSGIFKGIQLEGANLNYDGAFISKVTAQTLCPYNEVNYQDKTIKIIENSVVGFNAEITEADLNKTLALGKYGQIIQKLNTDKKISSLMKINNQNLKIDNDKLIFNYEISLLPKAGDILKFLPIQLSNINVAFSSGLAVKDGQIELLDFGLNSNQVNYGFLLPLVNKFNPTSWGISSSKSLKGNGEVILDEVKIQNSKIMLQGVVVAKAEE